LRLTVACIGKLKASAEKDLADDYAQRIQAAGKGAGIKALTIVERLESQRATAQERMAEEAAAILKALPAGCDIIALDERGTTISSAAFSALLQRKSQSGVAELAFVIGGADGHGDELRQKASAMLAFGPMTWPHRLVRIMVLEQIYRAVTILINHPYHRS
jgi:23S rRNA (pseudouridine1915-N3)-methyltransferase